MCVVIAIVMVFCSLAFLLVCGSRRDVDNLNYSNLQKEGEENVTDMAVMSLVQYIADPV